MREFKKLALAAVLAFTAALCIAVPSAFADEPVHYDLNGGYYYYTDMDASKTFVKKAADDSIFYIFDYAGTSDYKSYTEVLGEDDPAAPSVIVAWSGNKAFYANPSKNVAFELATKADSSTIDNLWFGEMNEGEYLVLERCNSHSEQYQGAETTVYDIANFGIYQKNGTQIMNFAGVPELQNVPYGSIAWNGIYGFTYDPTIAGKFVVLTSCANLAEEANNAFICDMTTGKYLHVESETGAIDVSAFYEGHRGNVQYIYTFDSGNRKCTLYRLDFKEFFAISVSDDAKNVDISAQSDGYMYSEYDDASKVVREVKFDRTWRWLDQTTTASGSAYPGYAKMDKYNPEIDGATLVIKEKDISSDPAATQAVASINEGDDEVTHVLDIHFEDKDGTEITLSGSDYIWIYVKIPDSLKPKTATHYIYAYYLKDDGTAEYLGGYNDGNYLGFATTHNSTFALSIISKDLVMRPVYMHRMYNPNSGEHFYTSNDAERDMLVGVGWDYEGLGWVAPSIGEPVYRMYNQYGGEHHYTLNAAERDMLVEAGWNYEGIGWYSDSGKAVPIYREYNPNAYACNHNYTQNIREHNMLIDLGWKDEGIGWYAGPFE